MATIHQNQNGSYEVVDDKGLPAGNYPSYASAQAAIGGSPSTGGSNIAPGGVAVAPGQGLTNAQLVDYYQKAQEAIASGNQDAYDEAVGAMMGVFNGQPTLKAGEDLGFINGQPTVAEQGMAGYLTNGDPTEQMAALMGKDKYGNPTLDMNKLTEQSREANNSLASGMLNTAAGLQGPQNFGKFEQYTGGGQSLLQQALSGRPASSAAAPGTLQPQTLTSLMQSMGLIDPNMQKRWAPMEVGSGQTSQADLRRVMGVSPDYSPSTQFTANDAINSGGYRNFQLSDPNDPTVKALTNLQYGGTNPNAASNPLASQPSGGGGDVTGDASDNEDLLSSIGLGAPQLGQDQLRQEMGTAPDYSPDTQFSVYDALNGTGYRNHTSNEQFGAGADPTTLALQNYERGLQILQNPAQMDPAHWDSLGPNGQTLLSQAAAKVFGWDPSEYIRQVNATRPLGTAFTPNSVQTQYAPMGS